MPVYWLRWLPILPLVAAHCKCGYLVQDPRHAGVEYLFTDSLESDFTKLADSSKDANWIRQEFNVSADAGRGEYGKSFELDNVRAHPRTSTSQEAQHDSGGLELLVSSTLSTGSVSGAELDTARLDLHWGSYRAGMKLTDVNGTCAAFFWYFNDTQEIDIEFLSREFDRDKQIYPINLVIQSRDSLAAGYNAQHTGTYARVNLTFDPTAGFHEYRFDYVPGQVVFYADSVRLAEMKGREVPSSAGHLILQHWSNGNPLWSGGPPARDAILTVSYVKAYFNSSDAPKRAEWATACSAATNDKGDVCVVPDVTAANASDGGTFLGQSEDDKQRGGGGEGKPEVGGGGGGGVDQGESNVASRLSMGMLQCGSLVALLLALGQ